MRAAILLLLASCTPAPPPAAPPPVAAPREPVAPPAPGPLPVTAWARSPEGVDTQLAPGAPTDVAPASILELRSDHALANLKVRFTRDDGALVPSHDAVQIGPGTTYRIAPEEPLPPGTGFRLEIGPEAGDHVRSADGAEYLPATFALHTTGEKPAPPRPHRRRRH